MAFEHRAGPRQVAPFRKLRAPRGRPSPSASAIPLLRAVTPEAHDSPVHHPQPVSASCFAGFLCLGTRTSPGPRSDSAQRLLDELANPELVGAVDVGEANGRSMLDTT